MLTFVHVEYAKEGEKVAVHWEFSCMEVERPWRQEVTPSQNLWFPLKQGVSFTDTCLHIRLIITNKELFVNFKM